jgi:uncharacterized membrane protein
MARQSRAKAPATGARSPSRDHAPPSPQSAVEAAADSLRIDVPARGSLPHTMRRYSSVYGAFVAGLIVSAIAFVFVHEAWIPLGAGAFFLAYLAAILSGLPRLNPHYLRRHADQSDTPGYIILIVALATVVAACGSLFTLLNSKGSVDHTQMVLGIASLILGWLGIHAMLAFHYAYEFYQTDAASPVGKDGKRPHIGGLDFPGSELPDALSFLYFSFVVAMTAQVSDVTVTSNAMRRLVLLHGILAFFFNTVILAIAVNVVVSLGH